MGSLDGRDESAAPLEDVAAGVLLTDAQGRLLAADGRAAEITGYSAAALAGGLLSDLLVPGSFAPATQLPAGLGPLERWNAPAVLRRKDGSLLDVELGARGLLGGATLWTLRDVAGQRQLQADLVSRLQALESSINGIAIANLAGNLSYVNASFLRMWGYESRSEVLGRSAISFWDSPSQASAVQARVAEGQGWRGELAALRKSGERLIVELSASMVKDGAGRPLALLCSFIDVTERTRATAALREGEERLRQAVRVAHIGIFDHDQRADTIYWSPQQREIYGFDPDETVTLQAFLDRVHAADLERIGEAVRRAHTPGGDGLFDVDHRITRRDGAVRWLTTRSQTFFEGEGDGRRPVRTVGAVLDITDARRAEEERERLQAQLAQAQKLESVGLLAGGVAHDFNNMLAVILGNAEMLRPRLEGDPAAAADLLEIFSAAHQARDVTRQLLAFSRKQVVSPHPLAPNDVLAKARSTLARLIGEDVEIQFHPGRELWKVEMDPSQFEQVLMNLAANARDAMPRGGKLTIETANVRLDEEYCRRNAGFRPGDYVLIAVSDTGVGMDRETLEHVFEPFFTTKDFGKGTGLGLATVHGIVAQSGGMVHAYSEPGIGSTFKIYLPRLQRESAERVAPDAAPAVVEGGTVLLVEDEPMVRRMTAAMLASLGLSVVVAGSPSEALELVGRKNARIDVLLTDVVMPGMSGKELRDRILGLRPGLPVLFMSGYAPNVIVHHGVQEEGVHLVQKPFTMGDLALAICDVRRSR